MRFTEKLLSDYKIFNIFKITLLSGAFTFSYLRKSCLQTGALEYGF